MKWSTPLPIGSAGIRVTGDQVIPSLDVVITMSFTAQFGASNRQSCHTTYTLPFLSISADTKGPARSFPATRDDRVCAANRTRLQLFPPSVDRIDSNVPSKQSEIGTMTVPLG